LNAEAMREIAHQMNQDLNNLKIKIGSSGFSAGKRHAKILNESNEIPFFRI